MRAPLPLWKTDPILYLAYMKYPGYRETENTLGTLPFHSNRPSLEELMQRTEAKEYIIYLGGLTPSKIDELVASERELAEKRELKELSDAEANRFYNRAGSEADYEYWSKMSAWSCDDFTALSLGKDPRIVGWAKLKDHVHHWPFAKSFGDRRRLIISALEMKQLYTKSKPTICLAWAARMKINLPDELVSSVQALGDQICDWYTIAEQRKLALAELQKRLDEQVEKQDSAKANKVSSDKSLSVRERNSLLKILISIAMQKYRFDPSQTKSSATKNILTALELTGFKMSEDTVRKYLNLAASQLENKDT